MSAEIWLWVFAAIGIAASYLGIGLVIASFLVDDDDDLFIIAAIWWIFVLGGMILWWIYKILTSPYEIGILTDKIEDLKKEIKRINKLQKKKG